MAQISIFTGSVYGGALLTARALKKDLTDAGHQIRLFEDPQLGQLTSHDDAILVCTSTTGQGELPSNLVPFWADMRDKLPLQNGRPFGVIVLGDSSYGDTYCGAGELMEEAFYEIACRKVGETLRIDAMETVEPESEAVPWARDWAQTLDQDTA